MRRLGPLTFVILFGACQTGTRPDQTRPVPRTDRTPKTVKASWSASQAPQASPRLSGVPSAKRLSERVAGYFAGHIGRRLYIQVDKPLYKPGETVWIKTWDLKTRDLQGKHPGYGLHYQLISPRGSVVLRKRVRERLGMATNDFVLPAAMKGGEYKLRVISFDGHRTERPIIISSYEPPRIKKKLEFLRKAYGAGDEVTATIEVKRPTGEPLGSNRLTAVVQLDNAQLIRLTVTTDDKGGGVIQFTLPKTIREGDGLLTVMVSDGGITESVSKRVPILLNRVRFALYPEGGSLVTGLPTRVYFAAKNLIGKPADVEGRVVDDQGRTVARFRSAYHGMGRFRLRPAPGRVYHAEITRPRGIKTRFALPRALAKGCTVASYDDLESRKPVLIARVSCTDARRVIVSAMLRETLIDAAAVEVSRGRPAVVYLQSRDDKINRAQGVARLTVFDEKLVPLAERLVYRNRHNRLRIAVTLDHKSYRPRERVTVTALTTDMQGTPVPAELALSVVDDTVVSYADDKTGHLLSRLYLEQEIPGEVAEPKKYFDPANKQAALGLDLLMGTRGYRSFAWQRVLAPPRPTGTGATVSDSTAAPRGPHGAWRQIKLLRGLPKVKMGRNELAAQPRPQARPAKNKRGLAEAPKPIVLAQAARLQEFQLRLRPRRARRARGLFWARDGRWNRGKGRRMRWARVRVFPAPAYSSDYNGPRTDFRETLHWAPTVKTDAKGRAKISFSLSDAITSFRVFTEGVGSGVAGRNETVFQSKLPFSMYVKLPVEVSAGDRLNLPLTLTNETKKPLTVVVRAAFGKLLSPAKGLAQRTVQLQPNQRRSLFYAVEVTGQKGLSQVRFSATAGSLKDEYKRQLTVVPPGFPRVVSLSGELTARASHRFDLGRIVPGSITASVRLYPSPLASMTSGMEGMLREPSGCFEQASSTNYPNVMVMSYLKEHRVKNVKLLQKSARLLASGYRRLTGYEVPKRGYEWFGRSPGHEALTAYGLMEFVDMKRVYKVNPQMIDRTATWLKSRRDGKGGFNRNSRALDSFGRASKDVTNAYITYSLTEAKQPGLSRELKHQAAVAERTQDAYLLALAANSLLNAPGFRAQGTRAARRLAGMQVKTGAWTGAWTNAKQSITRSGGKNLTIETTALAMMALIKARNHGSAVRKAMSWMNKNRSGHGSWGATQATVLGLKAMIAYTKATSKTKFPGVVRVRLHGRTTAPLRYKAGHSDPLLFADLGARFRRGANRLEIIKQGKGALPYSVALTYRSFVPAGSAQSVVSLATTLARTQLKMGETTRLTVTVRNKTDKGQPMTLVRVGFPGGMSFQTWQLKELRKKGLIAFYETRPREVILYFRQLKPSETRTLPITLTATVPGTYTAPASSAYLYYTDEHKTWASPVKVEITR